MPKGGERQQHQSRIDRQRNFTSAGVMEAQGSVLHAHSTHEGFAHAATTGAVRHALDAMRGAGDRPGPPAVRGRLGRVQPHSGAGAISPFFFWRCSQPGDTNPGGGIFRRRGASHPWLAGGKCVGRGSYGGPLRRFSPDTEHLDFAGDPSAWPWSSRPKLKSSVGLLGPNPAHD